MVLQCVAVCCSVLQCVAVCCSVLQCVAVCCSALHCVAVCCSVLQCVAVCCTVLQCVAVCCRYRPAHGFVMTFNVCCANKRAFNPRHHLRHTATTHCNTNTLQQHTATRQCVYVMYSWKYSARISSLLHLHCNSTLQHKHTATTHCNT